MFTIKFFPENIESKEVVVSEIKAGETILEVALNNKIDIDHDCGGVCSCSTCHIYVTKGFQYLESKSRKELHFIERLKNRKENSRLSCQCLLLKGSGELEVVIPVKAFSN
jgi:ferredoxin, 2Fe-2S